MNHKIYSIAIVHSGNAALPELTYYHRSLSSSFFVDIVDINDKPKLECYDVVWCIMGNIKYKKIKNQILIHEYASSSIPPFAKVKNIIKSIKYKQCDIRIFLNETVESHFYFNKFSSKIILYRDMGVSDSFLINRYMLHSDKKYDLIYVGSCSKSRNIPFFLKRVFNVFPMIKIAIVGKIEEWFKQEMMKYNDNIEYLGVVEHDAIPRLLNLSKGALNLIPDIFPYNEQTSTKLIEYACFGIPIVTTQSKWSIDFLSDKKIPYIDLDAYLCGENLKEIPPHNHFASWDEIIVKSNLVENIEKLLAEKKL